MGKEGSASADAWPRLASLPAGTEVVITLPDGSTWQGWLVPPDPLSAPRTVRLKLPSGYNVGILVPPASHAEVVPGPPWGEPEAKNDVTKISNPSPSNGPQATPSHSPVVVLATGGTIASRVDYVTGGVRPLRGKAGFEEVYPDLYAGGPLEVREIFDVLSEDLGPAHWTRLATEVKAAFDGGARGVVVTHGTDTMAYTASALAFQLRDLPGPVVMVGAQRSIDRPSSDGVANLLAAVRVAREADLGEVVVAMHAGPSDSPIALHRGTRVRKMHATRRDAFRTLNEEPLGILGQGLELAPHRPRSGRSLRLEEGFDGQGALLWVHPGLTEKMAAASLDGARGVILAGTGMGHLPTQLLPWVRRETEEGVVMAMTTQCLGGTVDPYVYSTGRELLSAGVLYLGDILPETAYVKLLWALHRYSEADQVRAALAQDMAGEFGSSRPLAAGGLP